MMEKKLSFAFIRLDAKQFAVFNDRKFDSLWNLIYSMIERKMLHRNVLKIWEKKIIFSLSRNYSI